jgi:hypothetical protein
MTAKAFWSKFHGLMRTEQRGIKLCPKCGRPLALMLPPGGEGERKPQCFHCDGPDPLKSREVEGWIKSPTLKPPAKC